MLKKIILLFTLALFLVGCSSNEGDTIFNEIVGETNEDISDNRNENQVAQDSDEPATLKPELSGELKVVIGPSAEHLELIGNYFMEEYPDVTIEFERIGAIEDMSQQVALATRLLADPPDILDTAGLVFEKMNMDSLFVDIKPLIDEPGGINRADYFDNVLRAAEIEGGLYSVPLLVDTELRLLNKQLFNSIDVTIEDIRMITLDEYIEFYLRAVEANPDKEIFIDSWFNETTIFRFKQVYDLNTGEVNVDTPEMRELLALVNSIPTGPDVEFTEQRVLEFITGTFGGSVDASYTRPSRNYMYHLRAGLMLPGVFFLQNTDSMQFSHPVHIMSQNGDIAFRTTASPAIMRESSNQELAWEFIRFAMEHPFSLGGSVNNNDWTSFPVNRFMFDDHLLQIIEQNYNVMINFNNIAENENPQIAAIEKAEGLQYSLDRFTELMEMLNFERRYSEATFNSIIYPDIYLLVIGEQDVETTLASIQNRLEIYVEE